ncbi:FKBP-type peptidyl-prolyl cis-trans isomerase [Bacteroidota bacterium]
MKIKINFWIIIICLLLIACDNKKGEEKQLTDTTDYEETLMKANQYLVKTEEEQINDFITRYNWEMKETGTGLRYLIYHNAKRKKAQKGQFAKIKYEIRLITGDLVYTSEESGLKEFEIGKANVETGLHEGILFLGVGDKAKFILPSHLAYGLVGDYKKIPKRATLVYDIELVELN